MSLAEVLLFDFSCVALLYYNNTIQQLLLILKSIYILYVCNAVGIYTQLIKKSIAIDIAYRPLRGDKL